MPSTINIISPVSGQWIPSTANIIVYADYELVAEYGATVNGYRTARCSVPKSGDHFKPNSTQISATPGSANSSGFSIDLDNHGNYDYYGTVLTAYLQTTAANASTVHCQSSVTIDILRMPPNSVEYMDMINAISKKDQDSGPFNMTDIANTYTKTRTEEPYKPGVKATITGGILVKEGNDIEKIYIWIQINGVRAKGKPDLVHLDSKKLTVGDGIKIKDKGIGEWRIDLSEAITKHKHSPRQLIATLYNEGGDVLSIHSRPLKKE